MDGKRKIELRLTEGKAGTWNISMMASQKRGCSHYKVTSKGDVGKLVLGLMGVGKYLEEKLLPELQKMMTKQNKEA